MSHVSGPSNPDLLVEALRAAVEAHGGRVVAVDANECADIAIGEASGRIYFDNMRRRATAGEPAADVAAAFARALAARDVFRAGPEAEAERLAGLRIALERREVSGPSAITREVSPTLVLALAWTDPLEMVVRYVGASTLSAWALGAAEAWGEAGRQMDAMLSQTPVKVNDVAGSRMAMLATHSVFKASLLAAPALRRQVEPTLGWPVLAVAPCRDFVYLLPGNSHDLVQRLGGVVAREYAQSPYPLSPELFRVSDSGIAAIGTFGDV